MLPQRTQQPPSAAFVGVLGYLRLTGLGLRPGRFLPWLPFPNQLGLACTLLRSLAVRHLFLPIVFFSALDFFRAQGAIVIIDNLSRGQ